MAETLTVALRVAEEAIEEAIAKAEEFSDSLVRHPSVPLLSVSVFLLSFPFGPLFYSRFLCHGLLLLSSQYQLDAAMVLGQEVSLNRTHCIYGHMCVFVCRRSRMRLGICRTTKRSS